MPRASGNVTVASEKQRLHGQPLTDQERQVLRLVCLGYTTAEIADELGIPERRARLRQDVIRYKTGCRLKRDLLVWARVTPGYKSLLTARVT